MARNRSTSSRLSCGGRPAMRWCRLATNSSGGTLNSVSSPRCTTSQNSARASGDSLSIRPAISSSITPLKVRDRDTPIRIPLPGEGRRLERNCFGRLQVSDVRGDVNPPAVSLQEPPEVRKVQELHAENAPRPVGVEIHAGGQLHRARRPTLRDLAPEVDVQGVRFFVVFESHNLSVRPS